MNVLVIAPHPDDEIIGVGGTISKYISEGHIVNVCIATRGCEPLFTEESVIKVREESKKSHEFLGVKETFYLDLPAVMLEKIDRYEINEKLQKVVNNTKADIVFIPHHGDMQKDHQIISEAAMVALRPKSAQKVLEIYAYETLSETEWNIPHSANTFIPNVYVNISKSIRMKLDAMSFYISQLSDFPNPRSLEAIEALAKYRGSTINVRAAEAFMLIRRIM